MTNRLFITLDIPDDTLDEITKVRNELYNNSKTRWESRDKLHITLKFLGDTGTELITPLENMLNKISNEFTEQNLSFNRFGIFYRNREPKIFWLGAEENTHLNRLQKRIEEDCLQFGYAKEKRNFHPHLTLLRIKGREDISQLEKMKESKIVAINFTAKTISLMKSELKPSGSIYNTIKSFELRKTEE